jgi:Na+/proline symporter
LAFALFMFAPLLFGLPPLIGKVLWPDISAVPFLSQISKPDENIFIAVVLKYMPAGMVGLFLAAMMSASMSAMDSAWNVVSAMFSIDIYKKFFKPNASEKETLLVGRLTIIVLAFMAIIMALFIVHSEYGVFTVSAIILGLIGIPVTIPLFFGILTKKISRWSAISSVLAGTIIASLCRFTLDFGIGPQYIIVTISTIIFVFLSRPLGKIHNQNKQLSLFTNIGIGIFIYLLFVILNANPQLSLSTFTISNFFSSPHFWLILAATMITVISYKFSILYAKDLNSDQSEVDEFFEKLDTPIDLEKEIYADNPEEFNAFPLVSKISFMLALLSLIMLVFPGGAASPWINISIFGILASVGFATFILDKKVKTT